MPEYNLQINQHGGVIECETCNSEVPVALVSSQTENGRVDKMLCEICYTTTLGHIGSYPSLCHDHSLYLGIIQLGHLILREIRERS